MNEETLFDAPTFDLTKYIGKSHIDRAKYRNGKSMMRNMYKVQEHWKQDVDETEPVPAYITKRPYGGICKVCGVRLCKSIMDVERLRKKRNGSNSLKKAKGPSFVSRHDELKELKVQLNFDEN
jgi:hypothetical protein